MEMFAARWDSGMWRIRAASLIVAPSVGMNAAYVIASAAASFAAPGPLAPAPDWTTGRSRVLVVLDGGSRGFSTPDSCRLGCVIVDTQLFGGSGTEATASDVA